MGFPSLGERKLKEDLIGLSYYLQWGERERQPDSSQRVTLKENQATATSCKKGYSMWK